MSGSSNNILRKLYSREIYGTFNYKHNPLNTKKYRFEDIPDYNKYFLRDIACVSSKYGQVFMGFTQCRRFLLTYAMTDKENIRIVGDNFMPPKTVRYTLYFWVVKPIGVYRVLSIPLFDEVEFRNPLKISIFQWPNRFDKLVVIGESMIFEGTGMRNIYLTVTKFPCLIECKNCRAVDCEQRREDFFDYNPEKKCYCHRLIMNTSFTEPNSSLPLEHCVSLKYDGYVVYKASSHIRVMSIDLNQNNDIDSDQSVNFNLPLVHKLRKDLTVFGYKMTFRSDSQKRGIKRRHIDKTGLFSKMSVTIAFMNPNFKHNKLIGGKSFVKIHRYLSINSFIFLPLQGCTARVERCVLEVETVLVTTDLDDKDESQKQMVNTTEMKIQVGIGYVTTLAGLDYALISDEVSKIILNLEGHDRWCLKQYDFAIIDVCPINGDILISLFIRLNVKEEKSSISSSKPESSREFETKCVILWNPQTDTDTCFLVAYCLQEVITEDSSGGSWNPARHEADVLRQASLGFFNVPMCRKIQCLEAQVRPRLAVVNLSNLVDH